MNDLWKTLVDNAVFVLQAVGIAFILFLIAWGAEKIAKAKSGDTERILSTRKIAMIGVFSAIAAILMLFEFPVPFAPPFYELDFSEIPALIGGFAFGPVAGVMIEFVKILLKLLIKGTSTAFVGDLANFLVGCSFILPASIIYMFKKTKKNAIVACGIGTLIMTVFGSLFNAIYLLPTFANLYGMPIEAIISMGTEVNKGITSISTLVLFAVVPEEVKKKLLSFINYLIIYHKIISVIICSWVTVGSFKKQAIIFIIKL